mmetsp:Transcript_11305/g.34863  ORF Transcript_11305/g.34863 Transcript_11305/m.34863 type:complete len:215 (+) Transcript_11305:711-1355(+)
MASCSPASTPRTSCCTFAVLLALQGAPATQLSSLVRPFAAFRWRAACPSATWPSRRVHERVSSRRTRSPLNTLKADPWSRHQTPPSGLKPSSTGSRLLPTLAPNTTARSSSMPHRSLLQSRGARHPSRRLLSLGVCHRSRASRIRSRRPKWSGLSDTWVCWGRKASPSPPFLSTRFSSALAPMAALRTFAPSPRWPRDAKLLLMSLRWLFQDPA